MTRFRPSPVLFALMFFVLLLTSRANAVCTGSGTSWNCTAGSTEAQVNTAINSASDGATITFTAGAYSWGNTFIELGNSKSLTLQGAGAGQSIVTIGGGGNTLGMNGTLSGNNTHAYRITGFTFQNAPANLILWFYGAGTLNNLRIDHNTFSNYATGSIAIFFGEVTTVAKFFALIDNNTFTGPDNFMAMKVLSTNNTDLWTSSVRGSASNVFLEDNTFSFTSDSDLGSGCVDSWNSSAVVFRFNTVNNCLVTSHGTDHGGGSINFEVYRNTLQRQGGDSTWQDGTRLFHHQGSGEITVWGNTFKHSANPISGTAISVTHYRSATPADAGYTGYAQCDGTDVVDGDGNTAPTATRRGWPCWMQPGRAPAGGSPKSGTLSPIYTWMNVDFSTGNTVPLAIEDPFSSPSYVTTHIVANRDYYDAVSNTAQTSPSSPFNGTTGMGFGTLANRPTTCTHTVAPNGENTGGVAYWATDQGSWNSKLAANTSGQLYKCTATNTWTPDYIPYTYPHPLQAGGSGDGGGGGAVPPAPPTNLQGVVH